MRMKSFPHTLNIFLVSSFWDTQMRWLKRLVLLDFQLSHPIKIVVGVCQYLQWLKNFLFKFPEVCSIATFICREFSSGNTGSCNQERATERQWCQGNHMRLQIWGWVVQGPAWLLGYFLKGELKSKFNIKSKICEIKSWWLFVSVAFLFFNNMV